MALYDRIYKDLLYKIKTGHYQIGDMLPPESEMEMIYSVSRAPVRQALAKLENLSMISRERGKGTRVIKSIATDYRISMSGFSDQLNDERNNAYVKTLGVKEIIPLDYVQEILGVDENTSLVNTTRMRYLNGNPIFYIEHYCPYIDIDLVRAEKDISAMRFLLMDKFKLNIKYVSEEISAVHPSEKIAKIMGIDENCPIIKVMRISYDPQYKPLEYMEYYVKEWKYKVLYGSEKDLYV